MSGFPGLPGSDHMPQQPKRTHDDVVRLVYRWVFIVAGVMVVLVAARWLYAEWWISTHCTTVLGTRVCR